MNKQWWMDAGTRAIKTFAQTALSLFTIGQTFIEVDWMTVVSVAGVSALYSVLTSLATIPDPSTGNGG